MHRQPNIGGSETPPLTKGAGGISSLNKQPVCDKIPLIPFVKGGTRQRISDKADKLSEPSSSGAPLLRLTNICFRYGKEAPPIFENLSFSIYHGDRIALIGANGVGKSTLLMLIAGALAPCGGNITRESEAASHCGLLMQNPDVMLIEDTVTDELAFYPRQQGERDPIEIVEPILHRLSLGSLADRAPFSLSRGERQRTAIGSILSGKPKLLLLDEPTTGQDRARIDHMMERLSLDCDAMIFSSHDLETAAKHANRVIVLKRGRIVADEPPEKALSDWRTLKEASIRLTEMQRFFKGSTQLPLTAVQQ